MAIGIFSRSRIIKHFLAILLHVFKVLFRWISLLLLIPLLALTLFLTPGGLKISLALVSKIVPGEFHYQRVTGTLLGPLAIKQFSYRYHDRFISASNLYLQWHPSSLLAGKINIDTLNIENLLIITPAPAPAIPTKKAKAATQPKPNLSLNAQELQRNLNEIHHQLTSLHLPVPLQIRQGSINLLTWQQNSPEPTLKISNIQINKVDIRPHTLVVNVAGQVLKPYSIRTVLNVEGKPQQYHFDLQATNVQTSWLIHGQINSEEIQLDTQKALIFGGEVTAHLIWQWQTPMSWQLALDARHIDLSAFQPNWPKPFDLTLNSTGYLGNDQPHFSWNAFLKTPQSQIATQGKYDVNWDIFWNLKTAQLAEILPFSSGAVESIGELHGDLKKPQTKGKLKASLLRWQDYRVDNLNASWDLDISESRDSNFSLTAEQVFTQYLEAHKIQISGSGKWENHQLDIAADAYNTVLQMSLSGGFHNDPHWQGTLKNMSVTAPFVGTLKLSQPTALAISEESTEISALCLVTVSQSQLCLHGKWNGVDKSWQAAATGRLNFEQIATFLPPELHVDLPLDLHINAAGVAKNVNQAQLTASTSAGSIRYSGAQQIEIKVQSINMMANLNKGDFEMNFRALLADQNRISADVSLPKITANALFNKSQVVQGQAAIEINNLAPIQNLFPDVINPRGKFTGHFTVSGTVAQPLVNGKADLEGSEVKVPGLNLSLDQLSLTVNSKGPELNYTLFATSVGRPIQLVGKTLLNQTGFPTELNFTGDSVLLADTSSYTVYVSPNIHIDINNGHIAVSGNVDIPKAVLKELNFGGESSLPENEVVYVGEQPIVKTKPLNMDLQLTINLGNDVTIDTNQIKGKLSGALTLISEPGQVLLGDGRIEINTGTLTISGRELTLMPGSQIIYRRTPITNPTLNIQASTRIIVNDPVSQQQLGTNELTVGLNIGGTPNSLQITLFSSAGNLSQADILSFLILGTSSAGISPTNMTLMQQALNTLPLAKRGTGGVEGFTNQIKQGLGLSELGVESEPILGPMGQAIPTGTPASYFVVGKRLTSRIYVRYKYDPFRGVNIFQLNYLLSKNWSIQLETDGSNQSGADILYTFQAGTAKSANKTTATTTENQTTTQKPAVK